MPDYAVSTAFLGRDKGITALFEKMTRSADTFGRSASSSFDKVGRSSDRMHNSLRNSSKAGYKLGTIVKGILAANFIRGGIGQIGGAFQKLGSDFLEFDDTMVSAAAKFDDIGINAKNFGGDLAQAKKEWRSFALGSRYSAAEVARSAELMAESGWGKAGAADLTPYLLKAGRANRVKDLTEFTDSMNGIFQGFNQTTPFVTLLDQITQGAVDARGGINDLKESLKVLAPTWQKTESSAATIAFASVLQNAGFPGDMVATAGKNVKARLARPDIAQGLKLSGIDVEDPKTGRLKTVLQLYDEITAKMKEVGIKPGSQAEENINYALFGMYSKAGNQSMLQHLEAYRKEIDRVQNSSAGVAGKVSDLIAKYSTLDKIIVLTNTVMDKGFEILERFNGPGQKGIEGITERIKNFDPRGFIEAFTVIGKVIGEVWGIIEPFVPYLPTFLKLWLAWEASTGVLKVTMGAMKLVSFASDIFLIGSALTAGLGPVGAMTAALGAMWVAAAPMVAAIFALAGIAGFGSAIYSAVTGKDNFISRIAQDIGIVPKLTADENGVITGRADEVQAPNAREAEARAGSWHGVLDVNAPPGSTLRTMKSHGGVSFNAALLGVNP